MSTNHQVMEKVSRVAKNLTSDASGKADHSQSCAIVAAIVLVIVTAIFQHKYGTRRRSQFQSILTTICGVVSFIGLFVYREKGFEGHKEVSIPPDRKSPIYTITMFAWFGQLYFGLCGVWSVAHQVWKEKFTKEGVDGKGIGIGQFQEILHAVRSLRRTLNMLWWVCDDKFVPMVAAGFLFQDADEVIAIVMENNKKRPYLKSIIKILAAFVPFVFLFLNDKIDGQSGKIDWLGEEMFAITAVIQTLIEEMVIEEWCGPSRSEPQSDDPLVDSGEDVELKSKSQTRKSRTRR